MSVRIHLYPCLGRVASDSQAGLAYRDVVGAPSILGERGMTWRTWHGASKEESRKIGIDSDLDGGVPVYKRKAQLA